MSNSQDHTLKCGCIVGNGEVVTRCVQHGGRMAFNGETTLTTEGMSVEDKLDLIIEALAEMNTNISELSDKVANLSLDNDGFNIYEEN